MPAPPVLQPSMARLYTVRSGAAVAAPGVGTLARTLGATGVRAAYGGLAVRTMRGLAARTCRTLALALAATTVLRDRRVQADRLARRETFDHVHLQVDLEHALDLVEQAALFRR